MQGWLRGRSVADLCNKCKSVRACGGIQPPSSIRPVSISHPSRIHLASTQHFPKARRFYGSPHPQPVLQPIESRGPCVGIAPPECDNQSPRKRLDHPPFNPPPFAQHQFDFYFMGNRDNFFADPVIFWRIRGYIPKNILQNPRNDFAIIAIWLELFDGRSCRHLRIIF